LAESRFLRLNGRVKSGVLQYPPMKSKRFLLLLCFGWMIFSLRVVAAQDAVGDLLSRINGLRGTQGLSGYGISGALAGAAQSQAQWMVDNGCAIAHVRPDGSSPRTRAQAFGYPSTDVSENIYCGSNASTDSAWVFWINSAIHYRGLINARYQEIGIASARGSGGTSFVLVFGNPTGQAYVPPAASGANGGAPQAPPSYVLGLDEHGNIMHEIQQDETLGDIALIYGYTWNDIPNMLTLNGLTQADIRLLQPGGVFLVPSHAGTYTPTPGGEVLPTGTYTPFVEPTLANTWTPEADGAAVEPTSTPVPTFIVAATANSLPQSVAMLLATATPSPSPTAQEVMNVAMNGAAGASQAGAVITRSGTSPWLGVALIVQVGVLVAAGFEFVRRKRKR
jgi:hypothetical protein